MNDVRGMKKTLYKFATLGLLGGLVAAGVSPDLAPYTSTIEQAVVEVAVDKEALLQLLYRMTPYFELISLV